jgi:ribonuclease T2
MRGGRAALLSVLLTLGLASGAAGQGRASAFDFYVLSLSWSPSFCLTEAGRGERLQCGTGPRRGFVVHGLWPQYERGWPQYCASAEPAEVPRSIVEAMFDIMPSRGLVQHQWEKPGACAGLDQASYFATVRRAAERVAVPQPLEVVEARLYASARDLEQAFIAANPGLSASGIAVACGDGRLEEIRICMTRQLDFRRCAEVDRRGCSDRRLAVPGHR